MRLTPTLAVVIVFNNCLAFYLSPNAPSTFLNYSVIPCEKFWWAALLHTQVYTNSREMVKFICRLPRGNQFRFFDLQCMHTTWYISVEWQMTVFVAPVLIYLLWKCGRRIVTLIAALIVVSSLYAVKIAYDHKFIAHEFDM